MITTRQTARAVADLSEGVVEIVRWWGSADTYRTEEWTADFRVGGQWRALGRAADGKPFRVEDEFLEIDPPRKVVQSWKPDWDGDHVTTVIYHLDPIAGGTRVTVRHTGFGERREACKGHGEGWEKVLAWLQKHLEAKQ